MGTHLPYCTTHRLDVLCDLGACWSEFQPAMCSLVPSPEDQVHRHCVSKSSLSPALWDRKNDRKNKRKKERKNERTKEWKKERKKKWRNEGKKEGRTTLRLPVSGSGRTCAADLHSRTQLQDKHSCQINDSAHPFSTLWHLSSQGATQRTVQAPNVNCNPNSNGTQPRFLIQWLMRV